MSEFIYTIGVDVGGSYVKAVIMQFLNDNAVAPVILEKQTEKIRKRNPALVADEIVAHILEKVELTYTDLAYLASTGEGEMVTRKKGHFYSMTTHAKGANFLIPGAKTVVDMGALYVRAVKINEQARVLDYKMTGQCASGSGQFVENISRYLGLAISEVGKVSISADKPEVPSGICAVLAETDVINMVSRGITTPNIIKGIHLSIAGRIVALLSSLKAESPIALTGGLALNEGIVQALRERLAETKKDFDIVAHPDSNYAGAIGAALWGEFRHRKLKEKEKTALL